MIKNALLTMVGIQSMVSISEIAQRQRAFRQARDYADSLGKPLLVVGTPKGGWLFHPCGDVTIDINPSMRRYCNTEIADIRTIPYADQYFGAAFVSHVLEHLPTVTDACLALDELYRVAEEVFVVCPHKISLTAWIHPDHHLWVTPNGDGFIIEQRNRTAEGASCLTKITSTS